MHWPDSAKSDYYSFKTDKYYQIYLTPYLYNNTILLSPIVCYKVDIFLYIVTSPKASVVSAMHVQENDDAI